MKNIFFAILLIMPSLVFAQKKTSNSTQKIKCFSCNGVGKIKDGVFGLCNNCKDWNAEYRRKVACHVCKDERFYKRIEIVSCRSCKNGFIYITPWDCIENYNKKYNQYALIDRGDYRFESMDLRRDDKPTIFMYYKDGRAVWAFYSDKKPIMYGKWECKGDEGYVIKWSDGITSSYGLEK
jgi:hypothetical protein